MPLAGPLPADASGGGQGRLTAVFINGRELHPSDVMALRQYGPVIPGRYGWDGGMGTSAYMDPAEDLVGILLTQRLMDSPAPPKVFQDFWTSVYQAIDE